MLKDYFKHTKFLEKQHQEKIAQEAKNIMNQHDVFERQNARRKAFKAAKLDQYLKYIKRFHAPIV